MKKTNRPTETAEEAYNKHLTAVLKNLDFLQKALKKDAAELQKSEGVNWGHVGTMAEFDETVSDLVDQVLGTGEYAEEE